MNTITKNPALECPGGHAWCEPHGALQESDRHSMHVAIAVGGVEVSMDLILDEHPGSDSHGTPEVYFALPEAVVAFDELEKLDTYKQLLDAVAERLTWFTVGVEVLKKFTYSVDHEPGEPDHHYWELGRAGTEYVHEITYVPERGWAIYPVTPDNDAIRGGDIIAWAEEVADLRIACDFLREACRDLAVAS